MPGINSPAPRGYFLAPAAAFKESDVLQLITTGTIATPAPTGALATTAGPAPAAIAIGTAAAAGAPAATYYGFVTYSATGTESLPSTEFVMPVQAGHVPTITVASAGAPSGATDFQAYVGIYSGGESSQAALPGTALGSAFTVPNPLTNSAGVNRLSVAPSATAPIVGLALHDSAALYESGIGGSNTAGAPANVLGTWVNPPPLGAFDPQQALVLALVNQQVVEFSLKQAFYPSLIGAPVGVSLDAASNQFVLDTGAAVKPATITQAVFGVPSYSGGIGLTVGANGVIGTRVQAVFTEFVI